MSSHDRDDKEEWLILVGGCALLIAGFAAMVWSMGGPR